MYRTAIAGALVEEELLRRLGFSQSGVPERKEEIEGQSAGLAPRMKWSAKEGATETPVRDAKRLPSRSTRLVGYPRRACGVLNGGHTNRARQATAEGGLYARSADEAT